MGQLQAVVDSSVGAGRGSTLGPDNSRRVRWWNLELECGHREQRNVKYRPLRSDEMPIRGGRSNRPMSDALPPPARVHCERCATLSPTHIDPAVVAGGSETER